jgi:hypothetical protein
MNQLQDLSAPERKRDIIHIARMLCRLEESVGTGCHCEGDWIHCRAIIRYARHATAIVTYLEGTGAIVYGAAP